MFDYFNGKTVALVGPADYLELFSGDNKNLEKIESCDVVVKLNSGIKLSKNYPHLVSSRTDILYNSLLDNCVNGGVLLIDDIVSSKIKHIRTTPKSDYSGIAVSQNTTNITTRDTLEKLHLLFSNYKIETTVMDIQLYNHISKSVKSKPTTGFVTIYDILKYNPKSLFITGFNFFMSPPLRGYWGATDQKDSKIPHPFTVEGKPVPPRTEKEHAEVVANSKRHVHKDMWEYAKSTLLYNNRVELDPILKSLLLVENFSKDNYNKIIADYQGVII